MMDVRKKEALEKRIVLGLVTVFLVTFILGPAKQLHLFHVDRSVPAVPQQSSQEQALVSRPLWTNLQGGQDTLEKAVALSASQGAAPLGDTSASPTIYTAQELRDPLKSLLPTEPPPPESSPISTEAAQPQQMSPPALRLQGLLWGGPKPKAIINDDVYGIGDVVEGATIKFIDHRQVTVDFQGTALSLSTTKERPAGQEGVSHAMH